MWILDVNYLGALCLGEGTEMETKVPEVTAMGQGRPSRILRRGRMSTAGGKERAAVAGETAACPGSTTRLQDFV